MGTGRLARTIALIAAGWGVLSVATVSNNFQYADDALPFVVRIHEGQLHPHHLILGVLGVLNRWLGWNEPSRFTATLWLVRGFVLLTSIAALVLCCALAWRWFGERRAVWWSAAALVASYGFWAYSVVPDFYVPGLASVLAAVAMLEGFQERERLWWLVGAVVFGWIAALCHQSYAAVLAVMVAVLAWERRWKAAAVAALGSAVLLLGSYVVAYYSQREYAGFWRFVLGHARYMQFTPYDRLQPLTPLYAAVGAFRAWTFPEYFVRVDAVWEWVQQRWSMKLLLDERFLLRAIPPEWAALLGGAGIVGGAGAALLFGDAVRKHGRRLWRRWAFRVLVGWALGMGVLAVLWEPSSNEFWLWSCPVVAMLFGGVQARWLRRLRPLVLGLLACATVPVVWLNRCLENDLYAVNKRYRLGLQREDVVLTGDFQQVLALNRLFPTAAQELWYELGRVSVRDAALLQALERLATPGAQGRLILDPLLCMPHRSESALRAKLVGWQEERVMAELELLARLCRGEPEAWALLGAEPRERRQIPLVGVWREGGGVLEFHVRSLPGMQWMR
jgi:hypothetical protein